MRRSTIFIIIFIVVALVVGAALLLWMNFKDTQSCFRPDPSNCRNYYNCFGVLRSCEVDYRYDETSQRCRHYYETECGSRYNPARPHPLELCKNFLNGVPGAQNIFPDVYCHRYIRCNLPPRPSWDIVDCDNGMLFNIQRRTCLDSALVECGNRLDRKMITESD